MTPFRSHRTGTLPSCWLYTPARLPPPLYTVPPMHISHRSPCTTLTSTAGVAYGHYEEPPRQIRDSRLPVDMQGRTHPISGYRLGRLTLSLAQATTWINPLEILCSLSPPSSPISRHVQSKGFPPPITLPRSMTSTSPFSTNKTSLQPMRTT